MSKLRQMDMFSKTWNNMYFIFAKQLVFHVYFFNLTYFMFHFLLVYFISLHYNGLKNFSHDMFIFYSPPYIFQRIDVLKYIKYYAYEAECEKLKVKLKIKLLVLKKDNSEFLCKMTFIKVK